MHARGYPLCGNNAFERPQWRVIPPSLTIQNGVRVVGDVDWTIDPFGFSMKRGGNVPNKYVMGPSAGLELVVEATEETPEHMMTPDEWKGPSSLLDAVIKPYVDALVKHFDKGFIKLMKIDNKTMRQLLFEEYKSETVQIRE